MTSTNQKSNMRIIKNFTDLKIYSYGGQKYEDLKAECLSKKTYFEDSLFPADVQSLVYSKEFAQNLLQSVPNGIVWKRPFEISEKPVFIDGAIKTAALDQGRVGNCWFIAACVSVARVSELIKKVVPPNQECSGKNYAGIFHFRFWLYGKWYDVVIDDRLPVSIENKLIFCRSTENPNEFWAALLEKAYAKVSFCYENLNMGFTTDAFIDMSGGIQEHFRIKELVRKREQARIWDIIQKSYQYFCLIGASIDPDLRIKEARLFNGLVMGHAYTVTKVSRIKLDGKEIKLIRIRNPWGNEFEWKGAWSDKSDEWNLVSDEIKQRLGYKDRSDGEYWLNFDDFYKNFDTLEICSLQPDAFFDEQELTYPDLPLKWQTILFDGAWVPGETAGGSDTNTQFWSNPQYSFTLKYADPNHNDGSATVIISLMQKYTREKRIRNKNTKLSERAIKFQVFKVLSNFDVNAVENNGSKLQLIDSSGPYEYVRDKAKRFRLELGKYIVIPSCDKANVDGEFLLRIFTEQDLDDSQFSELESRLPVQPMAVGMQNSSDVPVPEKVVENDKVSKSVDNLLDKVILDKDSNNERMNNFQTGAKVVSNLSNLIEMNQKLFMELLRKNQGN